MKHLMLFLISLVAVAQPTSESGSERDFKWPRLAEVTVDDVEGWRKVWLGPGPVGPPPTTPAPVNWPWITRGQLAFHLSGNPAAGQGTFIYTHARLGEMPLTGNPETLTWIIRTELPDGVDQEFLRKYIVRLVAGFGMVERPIQHEDAMDEVEGFKRWPQGHPELASSLAEIMQGPKLTILGTNDWKLCYRSSAGNDQLSLCIVEGKLQPFDITATRRYVLTRGMAVIAPAVVREMKSALDRAQAAEEAILQTRARLQWQALTQSFKGLVLAKVQFLEGPKFVFMGGTNRQLSTSWINFDAFQFVFDRAEDVAGFLQANPPRPEFTGPMNGWLKDDAGVLLEFTDEERMLLDLELPENRRE